MRDFWLSEAEPAAKWPDRLGKYIFCRASSRVLTNSRAVAERLPRSNRASVLHNGIDLTHFDLAHTMLITGQTSAWRPDFRAMPLSSA